MVEKKFSKEDWFKLSPEEREFYTLEFNKAVEKRQKQTIIATRIIALLLVLFLFFYGFILLKSANEYNNLKEQYGSEAFCYMCGLESLKKCECQYISGYDGLNDYILTNLENYSLKLAEYNSKKCSSKVVQDGSYEYARILEEINLSSFIE
jgi:hypothetical protein